MTKLGRLMEQYRHGKRSLFHLGPFLSIQTMWDRGLEFNRILTDGRAMADAALIQLELGFESVVFPFDLNVEAEILGARVQFFEGYDGVPVYPTIKTRPVDRPEDVSPPDDLSSSGRLPVILEALDLILNEKGDRGAVGLMLPGPFTLAGQVMDIDQLFLRTIKTPQDTKDIFRRLTDFLVRLKTLYLDRGVEFLVIEEGGATAVSPKLFTAQLLEPLKLLFQDSRAPHILSMTGNADRFIELMLECRPDGIGVDQTSDLKKARERIPEDLPFFAVAGSYDLLANADPGQVSEAVRQALSVGVDLVDPPADLYPPAKLENIQAFVQAALDFPTP